MFDFDRIEIKVRQFKMNFHVDLQLNSDLNQQVENNISFVRCFLKDQFKTFYRNKYKSRKTRATVSFPARINVCFCGAPNEETYID